MRRRVAVLLALTWLLPSSGAAGIIQGTVTPRIRGSAHPQTGPARLTDIVIYVERVPESAERKLTSHGFWLFRTHDGPRVWNVVQIHRRFDPHVLAIAAGDRVAFQNLDPIYHSAFSVSAAKRFDLGKRLPGQRDTLTFDRPGMINLHCDIHPDMVGYLMVTPNHAFAFPDSTGRYHLPDLPAGDYTVHAVHPLWGDIERKAQVAKRGATPLDLRF
jgi:plastocyanin